MAEASYLWGAPAGAGDGASSFTRTDWTHIMQVAAGCLNAEGIAPALLSMLAPSTTGVNNARIATGGAIVNGKPYYNTGNVDVTIPSASGGGNTRIDRVVLRADWTAQTVRITRLAGVDAASPTAPAITQTDGVLYDVLLCRALVNTAGTVTITDERTLANAGTNAVPTAAIQNNAVTDAKLRQGSHTSVVGRSANSTGNVADIVADDDDTVLIRSGGVVGFGQVNGDMLGNRAVQFHRRQGGDVTDWGALGTTSYTPTAVRMQGGAVTFGPSTTLTITFPVAFSAPPIVLVTPYGSNIAIWVLNTTAAQVNLIAASISSSCFWLAIGAE